MPTTRMARRISAATAIAAAAAVCFTQSANADFEINVIQTGTSGGDSIYVAQAVNTGTGSTFSTTLLGIDGTIKTAPGAGGIVTVIEGIGRKQVDIDGSFPNAFFGDPTGGTFIGIGDQPLPTPTTPYNDMNAGSQTVTTAAGVYINASVDRGGVFLGSGIFPGEPPMAKYKGSDIDPAFTTPGALYALEVAATLTAGEGIDTSHGAIPIANIVVPTGLPFTFSGQISEDVAGSPPQFFSIAVPEPTSFSLLMFGGIGLLARRRRIKRISI